MKAGSGVVASRSRRATSGLVLVCLAGPLLAVFGGVLFRDRQFAFQDAGHFYYPLLRRVQQEWAAGRWPLWAPDASAGTPLPFSWAMYAYPVGHVALAFGAMVALLRGWRISVAGAVIGACRRRRPAGDPHRPTESDRIALFS